MALTKITHMGVNAVSCNQFILSQSHHSHRITVYKRFNFVPSPSTKPSLYLYTPLPFHCLTLRGNPDTPSYTLSTR